MKIVRLYKSITGLSKRELVDRVSESFDIFLKGFIACSNSRARWPGVTAVALFVLSFYAICLNVHKTLYANIMGHDVIIFIDGITRIIHGHVPHLDFSSGLGLLNFYGPAFFVPYTDNLYQAFLAYYTAIIACLLLVTVYLSLTRLSRFVAICLLFYVAAVAGGVTEFGGHNNSVSYAMFYNHFGWAAFLLGFLFLLKPRENKRYIHVIDVLLVSSLLLFVIYTKATYALAMSGLYFLVLFLYPHRFTALAVSVGLIVLGVIILLELTFPGLHLAYINDLLHIKNASVGIDFDLFSALDTNWVYLAGCLLAVYLVRHIYAGGSPYSIWRHAVIMIYLCVSSLFIFENNVQIKGLPSLLALIIVLASLYSSMQADKDELPIYRSFGLLLLIFLFAYPELSEKYGATARHFRDTRSVEYAFPVPEGMKGLYFSEGDARNLQALINAEGKIDVETYRAWQLSRHPRQEIYLSEYAYTIAQGAFEFEEILTRYGNGSVVNFDFSNPFSAILGIEPAKGELLWYHVDRNISASVYPLPEQVFAHAKYVAVPKYPAWINSRELMMDLYGNYLHKHYNAVSDSPLWTFYRKKF